jgi:threonine/homoserine/homoserine lactone efflux protein
VPDVLTLAAFALVCLGMVLTPGPNMTYLVSRSLGQGPVAGLVSLSGVALGFLCYMLTAALGITALLLAVPFAYDALRLAGAAYLLWLAWQMLRPGGRSPFENRGLPVDRRPRLFAMGLLTSLLNPKVAMLYVSLLPQFIDPGGAHGPVLLQSIVLGCVQILVSVTVNTLIILAAAGIARLLAARPRWLMIQRTVMGTLLATFAMRLAFEARR